MIYVDSSVVLAALLAEDRIPPADFWDEKLASSRLLEYEVHVRLHALDAKAASFENAHAMFHSFEWLEMTPRVLARVLEPFPRGTALRTLDALHLASALYVRDQGLAMSFATYDRRLRIAAQTFGLELAKL